jgi:UDP-N-acetyl-D-galactosamine dehydrogenase
VDVEDPYADSEELQHEYGFGLADTIGREYDAVIITVPHADYICHDDDYFCGITKPHALIADLKGIYRNKLLTENTGVYNYAIYYYRHTRTADL